MKRYRKPYIEVQEIDSYDIICTSNLIIMDQEADNRFPALISPKDDAEEEDWNNW